MANTAKVGAGMVGSFQAVKGAMTLLGVESENVEAAIQKMQSSMAIVQGLQSIDGGIKSFKTLTTAIGAATQGMNKFKVALVATGLGALVVVLGSIIANWDEFTEIIGTKPGFVKAMWCGCEECETAIKDETGATTRCMPFEQENLGDVCVRCGKPAKAMVYFGKAY